MKDVTLVTFHVTVAVKSNILLVKRANQITKLVRDIKKDVIATDNLEKKEEYKKLLRLLEKAKKENAVIEQIIEPQGVVIIVFSFKDIESLENFCKEISE